MCCTAKSSTVVMNSRLKIFGSLVILTLLCNIDWTTGTIHLFLPEDDQIFSNCDDKSDVLGLESIFDMSELKVEILEDSVSVEGNIEVLWDVDPEYRIDFRAELLKSARGGWQPTVFSMVQADFCNGLFDENGFWYKTWGQFVEEDDRKCINQKGVVYHHIPFSAELMVDINGEKISGLHKAVLDFEAVNEQDEIMSAVCIQVLLDVITK